MGDDAIVASKFDGQEPDSRCATWHRRGTLHLRLSPSALALRDIESVQAKQREAKLLGSDSRPPAGREGRQRARQQATESKARQTEEKRSKGAKA